MHPSTYAYIADKHIVEDYAFDGVSIITTSHILNKDWNIGSVICLDLTEITVTEWSGLCFSFFHPEQSLSARDISIVSVVYSIHMHTDTVIKALDNLVL